jgi:chloramphenicol 3-O phosphotransferase
MTETGRIVLLNGTSSSGKSSIAEELWRRWPTPAFRLAVDDLNAMRGKAQTLALDEASLAQTLRRTRAGFHRAVAGMAAAGNDVIMDHVLSEPWRLTDCLTLFRPFQVFLVGVHCDPAELTRRELARGDRPPGTAAAQVELVHAHGEYDLTVDTTHRSAADCAAEILAALDHPPEPSAFSRLGRDRSPTLSG